MSPLLLVLLLHPAQQAGDDEIPLDAPYESAFSDSDADPDSKADSKPKTDPEAQTDDEEIPLDAPYESAFSDAESDTDSAGEDEIPLDAPYESAFGDTPTPKKKKEKKPILVDGPDGEKAVELEGVLFENRVYFRETTIKRFVTHPVPAELDLSIIEKDARVLEGKYKSRGYLDAKVGFDIRPGKNPYGRVAAYVIDAGDRARLLKVHISGNKLVPDGPLKEALFSKEMGLSSRITLPEPIRTYVRPLIGAGFYHKPFVDQDTQRLLAKYYEYGHLEARVVEHRVQADRAQEGLELTFQVLEGPVYELIGLTIDGDIPEGTTPEALRKRIDVADGAPCNLVKIQQDADAVLSDWREVGYPFAKLEQAVEIGQPPSGAEDRKGIALTLKLDKGEQATVGEVRVSGNQGLLYGTLERVILRDVLLEPGDPYVHSDLLESQRRLMSVGYFAAVEVKPVPNKDDPKKVDIEVKVTEQPTFLLNLAPAFVGNEGILLLFIAADRHLLGSGISVFAQGVLSFQRQLFDLTVTEPRVFDTWISATFEVHRRQIGFLDFLTASEVGAGTSLRFPVAPISWGLFLGGSFTAEYGGALNYTFDGYNGPVVPPNDLFPQKVFRNVLNLTGTWDKRDNIIAPRNGVFAQASVSYAGRFTGSGFGLPFWYLEGPLGADNDIVNFFRTDEASKLDFIKTDANLRLFFTPFWGITFKTNTRLGYVFNPHGGDVPVTDRYFIGGFGSVRGFFPRSLSPTRRGPKTAGQPIRAGGVAMFAQNTEIEFPLYEGLPVRAFIFTDTGNTYDEGEPLLPISLNDPVAGLLGAGTPRGAPILPLGLFWSAGFGLVVQTPILPLRVEWSIPLTRRKSEEQRPVDFIIGMGSAF